jgi:hypothetical protein
MDMKAKWAISLIACIVIVGSITLIADAGLGPKPPLPPNAAAVASCGTAYGLCAQGVALNLSTCASGSGGDTTVLEECKATAEAGAQACHDTFVSCLDAALPQ